MTALPVNHHVGPITVISGVMNEAGTSPVDGPMTTKRSATGSLMLTICLLAIGGCKDDEEGSESACGPAAAVVAECFAGLISESEAVEACEDEFAMASADGDACEQAIAAENECIASTDCDTLLSTTCDSFAQAVDEQCPSLDRGSSNGECAFTEDGECDEPEGTDFCDEGTDVVDCS